MKTVLLTVPMLMFGLTHTALAEQTLTQNEVRSLFTDKTFDGINTKAGRAFTIYFAPDGGIAITYADGKTNTGTWNVTDDGQHCVSLSGCSYVVDKGDGTYHKIRDGVQTHLLKNARAGKQL